MQTKRTPVHRFFRRIWDQRLMVLMALPFLIWMIVFNYLPLGGWLMAFKNYKPRYGIWGSAWVGFKYFNEFLQDKRFYEILRNTFSMSGLNILFGTGSAILLAVLLSEVHNQRFKRTVQTISYLPHFISWVVVSNIFYPSLISCIMIARSTCGRMLCSRPSSIVWRSGASNPVIIIDPVDSVMLPAGSPVL